MEKEIYVVFTNREYKGANGFNAESISFDKKKAQKAFNDWKKAILEEFADEIAEAEDEDEIEVVNTKDYFLYNDNARYYIEGFLQTCPCTKEVKTQGFVGVVAGLSDGSEIEDIKVFSTKRGAVNWTKKQVFAIKEDCDKDSNKEISWAITESPKWIELDSDASVSVCGFIVKLEVL